MAGLSSCRGREREARSEDALSTLVPIGFSAPWVASGQSEGRWVYYMSMCILEGREEGRDQA